jgi:ketohexokinase
MTDQHARLPRRVLGVGIAALDIVNQVDRYPAEDDEVRALAQRRCRGGNAANTLSVLSELGHSCAWAGTLADDAASGEVLDDLRHRGIDASHGVRHHGGCTPTSYITLSRATGSRTIVHYRDLPELTAADFARLPLNGYDWVHFEGRAPAETARMLRDCAARRPDLPISLEVEKPREGIEAMFVGPRVLIFSRAHVLARGYGDPRRFLADLRPRTSAGLLVLPWGSEGAYAQARDAEVCFTPAHKPECVVDTLGAGDVFNAGLIDGLLSGLHLPAMLARATRLAGHKCGRPGLDGVAASALAAGLL